MNEATQARDTALIAVEASNQELVKDAIKHVQLAARNFTDFTTDDVFKPEQWPFTDPRAFGAVMQKAAKLGYITGTDRTRKSIQKRCHARPKKVWKSNIYAK